MASQSLAHCHAQLHCASNVYFVYLLATARLCLLAIMNVYYSLVPNQWFVSHTSHGSSAKSTSIPSQLIYNSKSFAAII